MKNFEEQGALNTGRKHPAYTINRAFKFGKPWVLAATVGILTISAIASSCKKEKNPTIQEQELDKLRSAIVPFSQKKNAIDAGYNQDVTGYRTNMGHHFLNGNLVDDKFEIDKPEVMLYAPYGGDTARLVAVEYVTPIADLNNPPKVPEGFNGNNDVWEINTEFHLWTLHVWVGLENPDGIFASHNHKLP